MGFTLFLPSKDFMRLRRFRNRKISKKRIDLWLPSASPKERRDTQIYLDSLFEVFNYLSCDFQWFENFFILRSDFRDLNIRKIVKIEEILIPPACYDGGMRTSNAPLCMLLTRITRISHCKFNSGRSVWRKGGKFRFLLFFRNLRQMKSFLIRSLGAFFTIRCWKKLHIRVWRSRNYSPLLQKVSLYL